MYLMIYMLNNRNMPLVEDFIKGDDNIELYHQMVKYKQKYPLQKMLEMTSVSQNKSLCHEDYEM